jgi:phage gpG-like protein
MIMGTLTMISKTLRTPDLTTIQDALNIMQTEAKDIAEETANVIRDSQNGNEEQRGRHQAEHQDWRGDKDSSFGALQHSHHEVSRPHPDLIGSAIEYAAL